MERKEAVERLQALKGRDGEPYLTDERVELLLKGLSTSDHYSFIVKDRELANQGLLNSPPPLTVRSNTVKVKA